MQIGGQKNEKYVYATKKYWKPEVFESYTNPSCLVCPSLPVPVHTARLKLTMASPVLKVARAVSRVGGQLQNLAAPVSINATQKRNCKLNVVTLKTSH